MSDTRIWYSPYELQPRRPLSALSSQGVARPRVRRGALLRIESQQAFGYADLHPWEELGDPSLQNQLEALSKGQPFRLAERSLSFARVDAEARRRGVSLFEGLPLNSPDNHFLVGALTDNCLSEGDLNAIRAQGFHTLKLKISRNWSADLVQLKELASVLSQFQLRFDFNGQLTSEELIRFCEALPASVREALQFVEDPIPFQLDEWNSLAMKTPVPLALDRALEGDDQTRPIQFARAKWLVWKPAILGIGAVSDWVAIRGPDTSVCVTSYLDHPLGQMSALYSALLLVDNELPVGTCGLASHLNYEPHAFSERIMMSGARLRPVAGTGLGFDDLLASQEWRPLGAQL